MFSYVAFTLTSVPGWAYETDQLTGRDVPLIDSLSTADEIMQGLLDRAVAATNARTRCHTTPERTHEVLARQIHRATARPRYVWARGVLRAPGFTVFSKALERSPADRLAFADREDIFGDLSVWQSLILAVAGPCSTFEVDQIRTGSDKFDHFLGLGYTYWRLSRAGQDPDRAKRYGVATERSFFGLLTSKTFSWADLRANWDGYLFYQGLLSDDSTLTLDAGGCVARVAPFSWARWIDPGWDEVLNPPTFTRLVERGVIAHLEAHRDELCASRARWDPVGLREAVIGSLEPGPEWVVGPTPGRRDPFQLGTLCAPSAPALSPHPLRPRKEIRLQRRAQRGRGSGAPLP
ncbi:MAG TPA: hypothetical protein ENK18_15935 [Deltaproteobacteria bacterium]|nr:hypothetical protein [Deltaproteobacteria bacterium]